MSEVIYIKDTGQLKLDRANRLLAGLGDGTQLRNALYNALNRAGIKARKEAAAFATKSYTIPVSSFKRHVREKYHIHYGGGKLEGGVVSSELSFAGSVIPLIEFHTRYSKDGSLNVSVKRGGGGNLEHAFVANIGGVNIYERVGRSRFPLEKKYGPSAAHMLSEDTVVQSMEKTIVDTFNSRIEHEITRVLNGWGG